MKTNADLLHELPAEIRDHAGGCIICSDLSIPKILETNRRFNEAMESPYVGGRKSSGVLKGVMASAGPDQTRARAIAAMIKAVPTRSPKIRKARAQGQGVNATSDRESPVAMLVAAGKRAHRTR